MKKGIKIGVLLLSILVLTCACSKKSGTLTCTKEIKNKSYTTNMESKISYENGYVNTVTTIEEVSTASDDTAKEFEKLLKDSYIKYNKIAGFNNNIEVKNKKVVSTTTIDYKNIDTKKLIEIDASNGNIIKNGKVSLKDIKENFKVQGASCK